TRFSRDWSSDVCSSDLEDAEVRDPEFARAPDGHRIRRCGGLEADGEEDDLAIGVPARELEGVERGVDDPHVAAARADGEEVAVRSEEHTSELQSRENLV